MYKFLIEHAVVACSIFISICALFLTSYQTYSINVHNRLSVIPLLNLHRSVDGQGSINMGVSNEGTGPAIIHNFEIVDTEQARQVFDMRELVAHSAMTLEQPVRELTITPSVFPDNGFALKAGDTTLLFSTATDNTGWEAVDYMVRLQENIKIGVCYSSIYGDGFYASTYPWDPPKNSCVFDDNFSLSKRDSPQHITPPPTLTNLVPPLAEKVRLEKIGATE